MGLPMNPIGTLNHKRRVAIAFEGAGAYHERARVQRQVADRLGERLAALPLAGEPRVLELGCGSGFLSTALQRIRPRGWFLHTDLAPAMVHRCRDHLAFQPGRRAFAVMDGERLATKGFLDLIASSMTFQWFTDLPGALARMAALLVPDGHLAFATLGEETFREWRGICNRQGVACGTPDYPTAGTLRDWWPAGGRGWLEEEYIAVSHPSGLDFLQELKAIGAHRAAVDHQPVSAGDLRRLLRTMNPAAGDGFTVTYHILYGFFTRDA
ncbi:MAG: methyltransferase domain-containing protein [Magnetococcales bacterium]|nr:methyltransferase domain-containing protein [Magnetococcales bacterium]